MQLYFLAVATNILAGVVLAGDYLAERVPFIASVRELFASRGARIGLGATTAAVGVLTLLFPGNQIAVLGDFLPAVAGIAGGGGLLARSMLEEQPVSTRGSKTTKDGSAPVVKPDGPVERAAKLTGLYRMPLGLATLATGLAHFLVPGTIFF